MKANEYTPPLPQLDVAAKGDGALNKTVLGAHSAVDKVASAADDVARKSIPAIDRAADYAHEAVDKVANTVAPAAEWIDERVTAFNATQQKLIGNAREYVAENPLKALGIALTAGFLISRLIRK